MGDNLTNETNHPALAYLPTRRYAMSLLGMAIGVMATAPRLVAHTQQTMTQTPGNAANENRTSLHQEVDFKAAPRRIYEILLNAKQFAAFTGAPAEIDPAAGGAFSLFGGLIVGRNIEEVPGERLVQAWRPTHWDPGVYSMVRFELRPQGTETTVVLDHTGFPKGDYDHLSPGWKEHYWEPLKKYLA